jgi:hypothetical protein
MKNINHSQNFTDLSSPDNHGFLLEKPKDINDDAAEVNREVGVLLKEFPNQKKVKMMVKT